MDGGKGGGMEGLKDAGMTSWRDGWMDVSWLAGWNDAGWVDGWLWEGRTDGRMAVDGEGQQAGHREPALTSLTPGWQRGDRCPSGCSRR